MRIAMLTNNYKPFIAGVPISIERLSDGLRALGHEVYVFAPTYDNEIEDKNIVRYKSFKHKYDGITIPNMFDKNIDKKFKELEIDMIHVHHPMVIGWWALYLGKKYNVPIAYTYHTRFEQYIHFVKSINKIEKLEKRNIPVVSSLSKSTLSFIKNKCIIAPLKHYSNKCDVVFAPTKLMKDILEDMGVKSKIEILPTGLNNNFFKEDIMKSEEIRNKYIGDKEFLFCTISRLSKEKNIEFIIDGLKDLKGKVGDRFRTIIIGDGALKNVLKEKVKLLGLEDNVVFLSSIPNEEIKDYCSACDMFLFASKSETQGIVLLEAMASKNAVVAVKASGVNDIVKQGINGYATEEDTNLWSDKVAYLMNNKEVLDKLKNGAYDTAKKYKSTNIAIVAENAYKDIIEEYDTAHQYYQWKRV